MLTKNLTNTLNLVEDEKLINLSDDHRSYLAHRAPLHFMPAVDKY